MEEQIFVNTETHISGIREFANTYIGIKYRNRKYGNSEIQKLVTMEFVNTAFVNHDHQ